MRMSTLLKVDRWSFLFLKFQFLISSTQKDQLFRTDYYPNFDLFSDFDDDSLNSPFVWSNNKFWNIVQNSHLPCWRAMKILKILRISNFENHVFFALGLIVKVCEFLFAWFSKSEKVKSPSSWVAKIRNFMKKTPEKNSQVPKSDQKFDLRIWGRGQISCQL